MPDYASIDPWPRRVVSWFAPRSPYVVGDTYARRATPRFEFKPSSTNYTGGGYARVRSNERGPEGGPGRDAGDVFVSVHRLAAVAWHLDPEQSPAYLLGRDIHHTTGMPSANGADLTEVRDHGEHSEITQAQRRAWAEDAKANAERQSRLDDAELCDECDAAAHAALAGGRYCLEHATERGRQTGETVEIL